MLNNTVSERQLRRVFKRTSFVQLGAGASKHLHIEEERRSDLYVTT